MNLSWLRIGALIRPRLCLMTTGSALAGYLLGSPPHGSLPLGFCAGFFLLAAGSSALNQLQERDRDARMLRTARRPLPENLISGRSALLIGLTLCVLGLLVLWIEGPPLLPLAGLGLILCYNLIYTPLKGRTSLALIPGALVGAAPPLLGALAATGSQVPPEALLLSGLIFLWQFPHFWLLALRYQEDYRRAQLPNLSDRLGPAQFRRVLAPWMLALACLPLLFASLGLIQSPAARMLALGASLLPLWSLFLMTKEPSSSQTARLFGQTNAYMALLLMAIGVEKFL